MKRIITLLLAILILTTGFFSNVSLTFAEEAGVGINENLSSDNENALLNNAELPNETANEEQAAQSEETLQNELNAEEKTDESETAASESDVSGQENISEESFSENEQPALMRGGPSRAGLYVISCCAADQVERGYMV